MKFTTASGAFAVVAIGLLLGSAPAGATFPGKNGRIAFVQGVDNQEQFVPGDIFSVRPDGTGLRRLTSFAKSGAGALFEAWSPDGKRLAFTFVPSASANGQLWLLNANGSQQHVLLQESSFGEYGPSFSPDGREIAFTRCGSTNCAVYRIDIDGTNLRALTQYDSDPDQFDFNAAYSPDGRTIAFGSGARGGVIMAIYLMNADGSNIRELTSPHFTAYDSDWRPDGEMLAFVDNWFAVQDEELWTIGPEQQLRRLTNNNRNYDGYFSGPHDRSPSFAPEGNAIAFERDSPTFTSSTLYIMNPDGSAQRPILRGLRPAAIGPRFLSPFKRQSAGQYLRRALAPGIDPRWGAAAE
jgi:TolB protein